MPALDHLWNDDGCRLRPYSRQHPGENRGSDCRPRLSKEELRNNQARSPSRLKTICRAAGGDLQSANTRCLAAAAWTAEGSTKKQVAEQFGRTPAKGPRAEGP
jgi:hypothetical protein